MPGPAVADAETARNLAASRSTVPGLVVLSLTPGELPTRRFVIGAAALDKAHHGEDAAVEGAAHRRPLLIDGATPLAEMNAGSVGASLEYQLASRATLRQQVGQALPIASLVHDDAGVMAAGGACTTRNRPCVSAPPGRQELSPSAAHGALGLSHRSQSAPIHEHLGSQAVLPRVGPLGHVSGRCGSRRVDIVVSGTERG